MSKFTSILVALAAVVMPVIVMTGCGESPPPVDKATEEQSSRLKTIKDQSGGDWDKVTADDKKWLMDNVTHGSEASAKMLVSKPKPPGPGGPPHGPAVK